MRMNFVIGQRALRLRDDVVGGTLDTVWVSVPAGPSYQLVLNHDPQDAADRVQWQVDDQFQSLIAMRLPGNWGYGRLSMVGDHEPTRAPTFLLSNVREGAGMRLLNGDGQLLGYLSLYSTVVIKPLRFPANPDVVRAVVADCYRREPERVLEFVPCRAWRDAITGDLIPIHDSSLLPFSGWVYYIADAGELFPKDAVVIKPQAILYVVFTGCDLLVYRLAQHEADGIAELLRR